MAEKRMNAELARILGQARGNEFAGRYREAVECLRQILREVPGDASLLADAGRVAVLAGDYEGAVTFFDQSLKIRPDDPDTLVNKAVALHNTRRYTDALAVLDHTLELYPDHAKAWNKKARNHSHLGQHGDAVFCLSQVTRLPPEDPDAWTELAIYLDTHSREEEALEHFKKAAGLAPTVTGHWINLIRALVRARRHDEALQQCEAALKQDPMNTNLQLLRKGFLTRTATPGSGTVGEAEREFVAQAGPCIARKQIPDALRLLDDPRYQDLRTLQALGLKTGLLLLTRHFSDAVACCDQALAITDDRRILGMKGSALAGLGRREEAIACFNRTLEKDPADAEAHFLKGEALRSLGRSNEALACYDDALRISPGHDGATLGKIILLGADSRGGAPHGESRVFPGMVTRELALAIREGRDLVFAGKKAEAIRWFDDLIVRHPQSDQLWVEKGIALSYEKPIDGITISRSDNIHEAIRCYERAISLNPLSINAMVSLGMLYYDNLDFTEAHAWFDAALSIDPVSVPALQGKSMTFAEAARLDEAIEYCDKCLRLDGTREDIRKLRDIYAEDLKKNGPRRPLPGICFRKDFPKSSPVPGSPARPSPIPVVQQPAAKHPAEKPAAPDSFSLPPVSPARPSPIPVVQQPAAPLSAGKPAAANSFSLPPVSPARPSPPPVVQQPAAPLSAGKPAAANSFYLPPVSPARPSPPPAAQQPVAPILSGMAESPGLYTVQPSRTIALGPATGAEPYPVPAGEPAGTRVMAALCYAVTAMTGSLKRAVLLVITALFLVPLLGYLVRVLKGADPAPEATGWAGLIADGIRVSVIIALYTILTVVLVVLLGRINLLAAGAAIAIAVLYLLPAFLLHFARTGPVASAFHIWYPVGRIREIGWLSYTGFILLCLVLNFGILYVLYIPYAGIVLFVVLVPLLAVFEARYLVLLAGRSGMILS